MGWEYTTCVMMPHASPPMTRSPDLGDDSIIPMNIILLITGSCGTRMVGNQSQNASKGVDTEVNNPILECAVNKSNFLKQTT